MASMEHKPFKRHFSLHRMTACTMSDSRSYVNYINLHAQAIPSSQGTAFILSTRAHTLPLGVCFARTTSTSPRSSP
jgi:hypothetical protein